MQSALIGTIAPPVDREPRPSRSGHSLRKAAPGVRWEYQRAGGVVVVRHRGATDIQPAADWPDRLAAFLGQGGKVAMVGGKRLDAEGNLAAMGDFVLHPKGFHHHGKGVPGQCFRFPEEVDTHAAGVAVIDEACFDAVDGDTLLGMGQLGLLSLGLALRQHGKRVLAVPQVVTTDAFTPEYDEDSAADFRERFGFDWRCADLEEAAALHADDGLFWNARYHADAMPYEKYEQRGAYHWESYQKADFFRKRAHHLASAAKQCCPAGLLVDVGCGDGFFAHLFAQQGIDVLGLDPEAPAVEQSRKMTDTQQYPGPRPRFERGRGDAIPLPDASVRAVTLFDVIEHLANPVAVLREISRVLRPDGQAIIVTPGWQFGASSDAVYHGFEYTQEELVRQVGATPGLGIERTGQITGIYRDLILVARKIEG